MCPGITNTGLDTDADGVDNACDFPILALTIPDQNWTEDTNHTFNITQYFFDPDDDDLNYTFTNISNIQVSVELCAYICLV